ncbi:hypothetical protein [Streptomyces flavofungini]|uniref:hypothetical protein n=1 Tax=Streptomyces flavofungini TaxID=68200 RepID=UPI0034DFD075
MAVSFHDRVRDPLVHAQPVGADWCDDDCPVRLHALGHEGLRRLGVEDGFVGGHGRVEVEAMPDAALRYALGVDSGRYGEDHRRVGRQDVGVDVGQEVLTGRVQAGTFDADTGGVDAVAGIRPLARSCAGAARS